MIEGVVVYQFINEGSKSEGLFPFLYVHAGKFMKIWMDGDTSFNGVGLKEFDGVRVIVQGNINEYGIFIVSSINEST